MAGFIGSHLAEALIANGHQIIGVDNLFTGSLENIKHLQNNANFKFIEHDIVEPLFLDPSVNSGQAKIDQIYNLACPASPIHYQNNAVHTIKANTLGVINILGLARKYGATILQASTSEVYGDPEIHPQTEEYRGNVNPIGPRACYDEGKRVAETLCFDYHRMHGLKIKVARIFNTYGPKMSFNDGRVVSNFIVQALQNQPITIYGQGEQTRSFCYVSDLVEGLIKLMNSGEEVTGPINLGNPEEFTILELAKKVINLTKSSSELVFKDLPVDDPQKRCPNITKAKEILNWQPEIDLEEGLKLTISEFKERLC
ncbi:MAG: NAD-dependent epimerase/dehydratase [Candidatus Magasanikbacteria bacterium GW2011_GWC2_37_14]|uniref:UDP-glucuronate decarboxylase n=1 Tax=Candidatus Magasanikbacteria bacterium GW2011_GWC2_37_14 TaxID=1619046 RepID=A0A0G0JII5_9BACT|nr:MAG: NAD-dependent epimerase/dehydratase [Candidatus Magasanikbacteria bacterium GW2011_GWC2_37_14]